MTKSEESLQEICGGVVGILQAQIQCGPTHNNKVVLNEVRQVNTLLQYLTIQVLKLLNVWVISVKHPLNTDQTDGKKKMSD